MRVLAVNAGSSSVKLSVIGDGDETLAEQELGAPDAATAAAVGDFVESNRPLDAVGHRFVHGGSFFRRSVLIDSEVRDSLESLVELAPLHMPAALGLLDTLRSQQQAPQVGCFDTAFHASLPQKAHTYALPQRWRALGLRRYGFHGLSCAWALRRASGLLRSSVDDLRLVVAHLGSGASVTAISGGASTDTSMGFTPLEGLVMAARSGTVDPGALTWLQTARGVGVDELAAALETESGLLALAGTSDMREVERHAAAGEQRAALAIDVYVHRACACIASVAASLERLDALVFTGGVGEHAAEIRESICAGLAVLGLPPRLTTAESSDDCLLSPAGASPAVLRVHAREDLEIAREVQTVLSGR